MIVNNNNKQGFCLISDSKSRIVTCVLNKKKMTLHYHYLLHIDSVYVLKIAIKQAGIKL